MVLGEVPSWVIDGGYWFGLLGSILVVTAALAAIARRTKQGFVTEVRDIVQTEVSPIRAEIAGVRADLVDHMNVEEGQARTLNDWRAGVDLALRNIQQAQAEEVRTATRRSGE